MKTFEKYINEKEEGINQEALFKEALNTLSEKIPGIKKLKFKKTKYGWEHDVDIKSLGWAGELIFKDMKFKIGEFNRHKAALIEFYWNHRRGSNGITLGVVGIDHKTNKMSNDFYYM